MTNPPPLKVAVLINTFEGPYTSKVQNSFTTSILDACPGSSIDFFDPIQAQIYPDAKDYDLIVLSGGTADPMGSDPWVLKLQEWIRKTVDQYPQQKMMGVCWGHQTLCVTFGGVVGGMGAAEVRPTRQFFYLQTDAKYFMADWCDQYTTHLYRTRLLPTSIPKQYRENLIRHA